MAWVFVWILLELCGISAMVTMLSTRVSNFRRHLGFLNPDRSGVLSPGPNRAVSNPAASETTVAPSRWGRRGRRCRCGGRPSTQEQELVGLGRGRGAKGADQARRLTSSTEADWGGRSLGGPGHGVALPAARGGWALSRFTNVIYLEE